MADAARRDPVSVEVHPPPVMVPAPAGTVWDVLVDVPRWREWARGLSASGPVAQPGSRVLVDVGIPVLRLPARVRRAERGVVLDWGGGVPGVFTGHHAFELSEVAGGTLVDHWERFEGLGSVAVAPVAGIVTARYARFNQALRQRVLELA